MAKATYRANNLITGLAKKDLQIGDTAELDMETADPYVATGSLSLVEAPAAPPADADKGKGEGKSK